MDHSIEDARENLIADGLATVKDAEGFLKIGRSKLYEEMDAGRLTYCKFGRARRIPWREIRRYAADSLMIAV
jgi:excisionase family DNA binding protein